jgi:hypothetical protein
MEAILDQTSEFIAGLPEAHQSTARTLLTGWVAGGGRVESGKVAVRLRAEARGSLFTAATIKNREPVALEFCRIVLTNNGLTPDEWTHWSDDLADLTEFDPAAKYPIVQLDKTITEILRITQDLRDLARKFQ